MKIRLKLVLDPLGSCKGSASAFTRVLRLTELPVTLS